MEVRPDDATLNGALAPIADAVAHAGHDLPQRDGSLRSGCGATVVLEATQCGQWPQRVGVHLHQHLTHGAWPGRLHRVDREEPQPTLGLAIGAGERPPDDLETGTDCQHDGTLRHAPDKRPVVNERPGGADLGPVLSPAEAVQIRLGQGTVGSGLQQRDLVAPPFGPPRQHQAVPAVAVGAEKVGIDDRDAQRRRHAGAPSRSWNAV